MSANLTHDQAERARVAAHIARASHALHANVAHSPVQRLTRALVRVALARYRARGVFPRNVAHAVRTPHFVDALGTPCAVAHLLLLSGEHALVDAVTRSQNNATVRELAHEPGFAAWLARAGLSLPEAQAIQPSYTPHRQDCLCGGFLEMGGYQEPLSGPGGQAKGVLVGTVSEVGADSVSVLIEEVHGRVGDRVVGETVSPPVAELASRLGERVLVPVWRDAGDDLAAPIALDAQGQFVCQTRGYQVGPLDEQQLLTVLVAPSCKQALRDIDASWTGSIGEESGGINDGATDDGGGGGCKVAGSSAGGELGVLLALASALALRRRGG